MDVIATFLAIDQCQKWAMADQSTHSITNAKPTRTAKSASEKHMATPALASLFVTRGDTRLKEINLNQKIQLDPANGNYLNVIYSLLR